MLHRLILQHFRNYSQKTFNFDPNLTIVVGPNTTGKTNLVESIMLVSTGKSFRAEKDFQMIQFGKEVAHVQGLVNIRHSGLSRIPVNSKRDSGVANAPQNDDQSIKLEITLAQGEAAGGRLIKRYLLNDVAKSRNSFIGHLPTVLFRPEELDIIVDGPSLRRTFLDSVLEPIDSAYRQAKVLYEKALRQRNALLYVTRETGKRNIEQFSYWDNLLIENGRILTQRREQFLHYANDSSKQIFDIHVVYDKSIMSRERLSEYKDAEVAAGVTLVGPQRDDFSLFMQTTFGEKDIQHFGSRGQERLAILQLKFLQLSYTEEVAKTKPLLVLDDIFSELDNSHIALVLDKITGKQTIVTTTHKEFVNTRLLKNFAIVEL